MLVPVLMLLVLFVLWAGRGGRVQLVTDLAAEEAATVAALCCDEDDAEGRERAVRSVLESRPGLGFLCVGGPRPVGEKFVSQSSLYFDGTDGGSFGGVGVLGVEVLCETDGAVAPLRGVFPRVSFVGRASEVVLLAPPYGKVPGLPLVSVADVDVPEDAGEATFTLKLDERTTDDVTVSYKTLVVSGPGGATAGENAEAGFPADYVGSGGTVTIDKGRLSTDVTVSILDDIVDEPDETFELQLLYPINATVQELPAKGTIVDNDDPPTVSVEAVSVDGVSGVTEGDAVEFVVKLSEPSAKQVSVRVMTEEGSATAGDDYNATPVDAEVAGALITEVAFAPGDTLPVSVFVQTVDDDLDRARRDVLPGAERSGARHVGCGPGDGDHPRR